MICTARISSLVCSGSEVVSKGRNTHIFLWAELSSFIRVAQAWRVPAPRTTTVSAIEKRPSRVEGDEIMFLQIIL